VEAVVDALNRRLADHALEVVRAAGGFWMTTRPEFHLAVEQALTVGRPEPLSHGAWETLAVVAYRQPVTRLEIEALRGVNCERTLDTLLQRGLIEEVGRKEVPGRPIMYGTTARFLAEFGLDRLEDLPPLPAAEDASSRSAPQPGDQPGSISGP
jgi:segregation and condensation protein B